MAASVALWTQLTHHLNSLVWLVPLPERVKARVSEVVYRNPPMPAERVAKALAALDDAGVSPVVMGGWGIDALAGAQRRVHRDLDLIVDRSEMEAGLRALGELGYEEWFRHESSEPIGKQELSGDVIAVWDAAKRVVELHPARIECGGLTLTHGTIGGKRVLCLSAGEQVRAQSGYRKRRRSERRRRERNLEAAKSVLAPDRRHSPESRLS